MGSRLPLVNVVVLNWNQLELTLECLESLQDVQYPHLHITLVDNGSTDGSATEIRSRYPGVQVIESAHNLGFSAGNNVGIRHAMEQGADYVVLLNNDTVVDSSFVTALVEVGEADRELGLLAPKMFYYDRPKTI
jgi:GT2 family glycosyltransferase